MPPALALLAVLCVAADGPADFVWLEGEAATASPPLVAGGWGRTDRLAGGNWLAARATPDVPAAGASATWPFTATAAGRYDVWARVGFAGGGSPFRWRVAGRPWVDVPGDAPPLDVAAVDEATPVGWVKAGSIDLPAGQHTLEVGVPRPAAGPLRFALDAVCLVRGPFLPDGPHKPGTAGRAAIDWEAATRGFEFPPPVPGSATHARRTLDLTGIWQAARWDELEPGDRTAHVAALPTDVQARPWRGLRVPGDLATVRPDWAYCHRFLLRTRFTLPPEAAGRSVVLRLPNTSLLTSVFVNGRLVGRSEAPHAPFTCDLGGTTRPGPNELVVTVKDSFYAVAGVPWAALRTLPPDRFATSELTRALDWPVRTSRRGGLLEAPTLTLAGPAYVADLFAKPVAGRLGLDVTVRNPGPTPRTVEVRPIVRPLEMDGRVVGGKPAKEFAPKAVTLPADGEAVVNFDEAWPAPRLWWPDDPVRYAAEVTLLADGRSVDEADVRFGFREWNTAGGRITLNGVPWKLTADRLHADPQPGPQAPTAVKAWRATGRSLFRFAGEQPWTGTSQAATLGFFDAAGVPVWRTGTGDDGGTAANRQTQFLLRVRAERNSSAVAVWEVPPGVDPAAVRAIDPTRPALPLDRRPVPPVRELPDAAFAPTTTPELAVRPLADEPPGTVAAVGGEAALLGRREAAPGLDRLARMQAEGDRWRGTAAVQLDVDPTPASTYPNALQPVAVLVREWDTAVPTGRPLVRTLKLLNDTRVGTPITVHWLLRVRGPQPTELRGKRVVKLPPGGAEEFPLTLPVPAGDRLDLDLVLSCEREGRELFRDVRTLRGYGPPPVLDAPAGSVAVWDPAGRLPGFAEFPRVADPFAPPAGCRVLVVGPDAVSQTQATDPRWKALAADGLRLVVLDQSHPLHYQALTCDVAPTPHSGRFAFPPDPRHPAFAGLVPDDFACWGLGHTVYRRAYTAPTRGGRSLLQCDDELSCSALVEVPVGTGLLLLSQLAVRDHPADPVARRVVANLVRHALGFERRTRPTAMLLPPDARRDLLAGTGVLVRQPDSPAAALQAAEVVVLDGTPDHLRALAADPGTEAFLAAGNWLVVWGVGPDALPAFNRLVGVEHLLRPFRRERVSRHPGRDPLAAHLSVRDFRPPTPGGSLFTHVVDAGDELAAFTAGPPPAGAARPVWAGTLPRRETVTAVSASVTADHRTATWVRITFDDDPATARTVQLRPTPGLRQEFPVDPPRVCRRVAFEPLGWAGTGSPASGLDEVGVRVRRPADFVRRVVPLDTVGGLVKYPRGAGGVVLCQVKADPADAPAVKAAKRNLVAGLLRGLGAEFAPERVVVAGPGLATAPLSLDSWAGPRAVPNGPSLDGLPVGPQVFGGVRFDLPAGPKAVVAGDARGVPVGRTVDALFFLHAFKRTGPLPAESPAVLVYTVRYADGGTAVVPVRVGQGVADSGADPKPLPEAVPAWTTGAAAVRTTVYQQQWTNPHPDAAVTGVDVTVPAGVGRVGVPVVLGVSAGVLK